MRIPYGNLFLKSGANHGFRRMDKPSQVSVDKVCMGNRDALYGGFYYYWDIRMITLEQYYMGRDRAYGNELTDEKRANAAKLIDLVNRLIPELQSAGILLHQHPTNKSPITSGWRPARINQTTPNAAVKSKHMTCQAVDLYDPEGDLGEWAMDNQATLEKIGLWFESPGSTKGWLHLQSIPFNSYKSGGKRWFYP